MEADEQLATMLEQQGGQTPASLHGSVSFSQDTTKRSANWMNQSFGSTVSTTASSPGGRLPKLRGVPRFDFPRVGTEVMSPLAMTMGSFSSSMSASMSAPHLAVSA